MTPPPSSRAPAKSFAACRSCCGSWARPRSGSDQGEVRAVPLGHPDEVRLLVQRQRGDGSGSISGIPVQEVLPMKPETAAKVKYGIWGLICGAIIAMIIGFAWGGWTTSGTTQTRTTEAVLASQAAICVAQFMKQPNQEEKLKALGEVNSWQ